MTASPPAVPGMPGEETLARWLCAREGHTPEQVDGLWPEWLDNALELLAMFRPAFEAKDADLAAIAKVKHYLAVSEVEDPFAAMIDECEAMEARALSAEAKLSEKDTEIAEAKRIEHQTFRDAAAVNMRADALEAKLAQAVEAALSLSEKLTKAEAEITAMGGARATYFDGELIICHPDMPPHIWDGKKMIRVKFEPAASDVRGEKT